MRLILSNYSAITSSALWRPCCIVILVYVLLIYKNTVSKAAAGTNSYAAQPLRCVLDFLSWGYEYYTDKLDDADKQRQPGQDGAGTEEDRRRVPQTFHCNRACRKLSGRQSIVGCELRNQPERGRAKRGYASGYGCDSAIRASATSFQTAEPAPRITFSATRTTCLPCRSTKATHRMKRNAVHFAGGLLEYGCVFSHILVLKEYANDSNNLPRPFAIPVPNKAAKWEERVLPGAPEAFLNESSYLVGGTVQFGSGVPKSVQDEVKKYFAKQPFKCFVSAGNPIQGR